MDASSPDHPERAVKTGPRCRATAPARGPLVRSPSSPADEGPPCRAVAWSAVPWSAQRAARPTRDLLAGPSPGQQSLGPLSGPVIATPAPANGEILAVPWILLQKARPCWVLALHRRSACGKGPPRSLPHAQRCSAEPASEGLDAHLPRSDETIAPQRAVMRGCLDPAGGKRPEGPHLSAIALTLTT